MTEWVNGTVVQVKHWTNRLFSLTIHAPISPFIAGQFAKLRLEINGEKIQRAYSYVNPPKNSNLEFYLVNIPNGKLSPELHKLKPGDKLMITKEATGFFILNEIPSCENLWMIATGTAIGPYLSILKQKDGVERFSKIILVHATKFIKDLNYLSQMLDLHKYFNGKLNILTIVSRERNPGSLTGRIPTLIVNGSLEKTVNINIRSQNSHIMLCGNPNMVRDTQQILRIQKGMHKHFKKKPGHITIEHYW